MKYQAKIKRDGTLEFLGAPPPGLVLPGATKTRFSEIVPCHPVLRVAFRIIRYLFDDGEGPKLDHAPAVELPGIRIKPVGTWTTNHMATICGWTRKWKCEWEATILLGPCRGQRRRDFNRQSLIEWEQGIWRNN